MNAATTFNLIVKPFIQSGAGRVAVRDARFVVNGESILALDGRC
jgi:hypothetical protein